MNAFKTRPLKTLISETGEPQCHALGANNAVCIAVFRVEKASRPTREDGVQSPVV